LTGQRKIPGNIYEKTRFLIIFFMTKAIPVLGVPHAHELLKKEKIQGMDAGGGRMQTPKSADFTCM
jgi:hypothetical protein